MTKVVIDMTMSLDGFVAGPGDDGFNAYLIRRAKKATPVVVPRRIR